ncbi:MAG: hypothetical protein Q8N77_05030 [Nanoarchaeota archaeon]|nr:hypothetical protein [Nanoarchaeota archaeon]
MAFDSDYWNALDKQSASNLEISPKDIGISMGAGDVLEGIKSAINMGASTVELGFTGTGKGSIGQGSTTPEMFGKDKREAIRQLAKVNEINVTTHATIGVGNLSGLSQRGFERQAQQNTLHEIQRTVDFAADTTKGGPVTVHTGEFPRIVAEKFKGFELYPEEAKRAPVYLVDEITGNIIQAITRDVKLPFVEKDEKGNPKLNEKGEVDFKLLNFDEFRKWKKETEKKEYPNDEIAAQEFYKAQLEQRKEQLDFEKRRWGHEMKRINEELSYLGKVKGSIDELYKKDPDAAKYNAMKYVEQLRGAPHPGSDEYKDFLNDPIKFLNKSIDDYDYQKKYYQDAVVSYGKQEASLNEELKRIKPISEIGKQRTSETIANAAMYAWDKEKAQHLEKPLFISPENIFPETGYGSHPEELREMIINARKKMADNLVRERGFSGSDANKIAGDHIKATFDVGHAYTWKKFFQVERGEGPEDTEKRFNKWLLKEVDKLTEEGIIGHVHLSDNFGYYDEHLTPGMGSAPLKDFVEHLKKAGHMEPMIAEGGAQSKEEYYQTMTGGWKHLASSPIYRTAKWTDIEDSYFGRTASPTYIVGQYAPSQEYTGIEKGAPFWTGLGLE